MTIRKSCHHSSLFHRAAITVGIITSILLVLPVQAQLTPTEINELRNTIGNRIETMQAQLTPAEINYFRNTIGNRIEAATILGGDYGIGGGAYSSSANGDNAKSTPPNSAAPARVGAPQQLGDLDIGWQPRVQGGMGYLTAKNDFQSGLLEDDTSEYKTFAIQFGGGARFWLSDHFSIAPTVMGMYGHTENDFTARNQFSTQQLARRETVGID